MGSLTCRGALGAGQGGGGEGEENGGEDRGDLGPVVVVGNRLSCETRWSIDRGGFAIVVDPVGERNPRPCPCVNANWSMERESVERKGSLLFLYPVTKTQVERQRRRFIRQLGRRREGQK